MSATQMRTRQKFALGGEPLFPILKGMAQTIAQLKLSTALFNASWTDFTDNSTGVAGSAFSAMLTPSAAFDATASTASADSATVAVGGTGGSYVPGDTVSPGQDTGTEPVFPVTDTEVRTVAVQASGTGADATGVLFTVTTGTGRPATFHGDIATNTLSNLTLVDRGDYTVNPTLAAVPVTAAGYTGYTVNLTMRILKVGPPTTAGSVTVIHTNPQTTTTNSATGTGATLTVNWNAGVTKTNYDSAATAADNAMAVLAESINKAFTQLGLPAITYGGTVSVSGTIPAQTLQPAPLTPASPNATALDFATGAASMVVMRNNMSTLVRAYNMLQTAVGGTTTADMTGGSPTNVASGHVGVPYTANPDPTAALALTHLPATTAGTGTTAGNTSVSQATVAKFFTALANNVATMAAKINTLLPVANASGAFVVMPE